jgi:ribosomal protein S18 acetylase RimI-like enzyme
MLDKDISGGYVLEFGRLPEYKGQNIGKQLIDATIEDALKKGFIAWKLESRPNAQRFIGV